MWDQFKQSAYFMKPHPKYVFSASLPCTASSLESYILQLKQYFLACLTAFTLALERIADREKQRGTAASEQLTQAKN